MPGKIRIRLDKIDMVVPRFHSSVEDRKWWHGGREWTIHSCQCCQCKTSKLKLNRDTLEGVKVPGNNTYMPKGRTYRDKIINGLDKESYDVSYEDGYAVFEW